MAAQQSSPEVTTMWNKNFICVIIANFMLCLAHHSVTPLVASYTTKVLNASAEQTGFLVGMFFFVSFFMHPFAGPAMTKIDKRKLLVFAFGIGCIASVGYAMFHSIPAFVAFRFLSGVQYSMIGGLIMTLAADHLPVDKLAYGMGIYGIGGAIGTAVAPAMGIRLLNFGTELRNEGFGFTLAFLLSAVILAVAIVPSLMIAPDSKTKEDVASTGAWYKNIFTKHALPTTILIFFIMMPFSMINSYMVKFGESQGIQDISLFFVALAGALAVSRPFSGYLTNRFGIKKIVFPALAMYACAMIVIGFSTSLLSVIVGAVLAATGYGAAQPSIQAMCMQSEPMLKRGVASNTLYMGMDLGLFAGPWLGGFVNARLGYSTMYKVSAIPIGIAIVCFAVFMPIHNRRQSALAASVKH